MILEFAPSRACGSYRFVLFARRDGCLLAHGWLVMTWLPAAQVLACPRALKDRVTRAREPITEPADQITEPPGTR
jgi:hypothetical protein